MVPTLAATGIQRLELSVLIGTGIQTAIGLTFAMALLGAAMSLRRPAMWSLSLIWGLFTVGVAATGLLVVVSVSGGSPLLTEALVVFTCGVLGTLVPAIRHAVAAIRDQSTAPLPPARSLVWWGVGTAAVVQVADAIARRAWPAFASVTVLAVPRLIVAAIALEGASRAWRAARVATSSRRSLRLLAFGLATLGIRAPVNAIVAYGGDPSLVTTVAIQLVNVVSFACVGAASLIAALEQERTAYVAQSEALQQSEARRTAGERLESLGRLAAGIAHDFNNILTVIGASTMMSRLDTSSEQRDAHLAEVEAATARASDLTRQLLAFASQQSRAPQRVDVGARLGDMASLLSRLAGSAVQISVAPSPEACAVHMDPSQFDQIVFNLVANARDAMPAGGRLSISATGAAVDSPRRTAEGTVAPGRYVLLTFEDSGTGMSPEVLNHIFEPFFTTKSGDKGTGLGLATVYGVVKQAEGEISVWSEPGRGSRFEILLPAAA
jgi:signal transduction histidine kinase